MKNWLNVALVAIFAIVGTLIWMGVRNHQTSAPMIASSTDGADTTVLPTLKIQVETLPQQQVVPALVPTSPANISPALSQPDPSVLTSPKPTAVAARDGAPTGMHYMAQPGDTISKLAVDFFGSDTKANEDAIINSNPSLKDNPDRILAGQAYVIPARFPDAADATVASPQSSETATTQAPPASDIHHLRYSARPGDTVSSLAGALLGSDSNENRDTIINANPSLAENPDRILAGKTYQIPVQSSQPLAAAPTVTHDAATPPSTQPDADQLVLAGSARELRYTAKAGDNVSTLALALLGSDTQENRDAIINSNPSLKQDPDRVLAGQTYWIPAPTAIHP